jgi:hypothetical protein
VTLSPPRRSRRRPDPAVPDAPGVTVPDPGPALPAGLDWQAAGPDRDASPLDVPLLIPAVTGPPDERAWPPAPRHAVAPAGDTADAADGPAPPVTGPGDRAPHADGAPHRAADEGPRAGAEPDLADLPVTLADVEPRAGVPAAAGDPPPRPVAELVERLDADDVVDGDDVAAEMAALGVQDDDAAIRRYGLSADGLRRSVLAHLRLRRAHRGVRRAPARRAYLTAALLRCALYLGPLGVAVAAADPLGRVGWLVPALTFALGWSAAQALTSIGAVVAGSAGAAPAARLVGGGFAAVAGLWCAFVWVAPDAWLGPHRMLAGVVGVGGLAALAAVTAALVTRAEAGVVRWSVPCWLLGAVEVAGAAGQDWAARVPVGTLLPAAIVVAVIRAYRPVIGRRVPDRPPLTAADLRRGIGYLVVGAAQAACVLLIWRAGPTATTAPAAVPLLLAVPALEVLVGWHRHQMDVGLDAAESGRDFRRHVRSVAVATVATLLPPLAAGFALAAAAYRLPYGLADVAGARESVLAVAAGTLLGGLLAATFLLAARGRTAIAATCAAAAPLAIVALPLAPVPELDTLPRIVAVLALTHLLGLLTVAHTAADHRRTS